MRVWFNQWFSTAYHLIQWIKNDSPRKFIFVGSSRNPYALYKENCDEWYCEPESETESEYVQFCLKFCQEHRIDIFVPRRGRVALAKYRNQFCAQQVKLLCGQDTSILTMLDDKEATYRYFLARHKGYVPEFAVVHTFSDFEAAYEKFAIPGQRVCYKLVRDEGATTFRVIDDTIRDPGGLWRKPGMKVTWQMAQTIVQAYDFSVPLMVMPYLDGQEISVDCLQTRQGAIIIPRYKTNHRYSEVRYDEAIMGMSLEIMEMLQLETPLNIQFKGNGEKMYLLEINSRMSGGLQSSCLASGINIPDIAINQLIGIEKKWHYPEDRSVVRVANLETPVLL